MVKENLAPKPLYRVQVGAYSEKFTADAMLVRVKAAGFRDAIVQRVEQK
jgi:cell division protein FtsN